jgi:vacuolar-type H+-ATPase catalytic subunit A/Vma1
VKDFMDDQARERLLSLAQAAMQNQLIDMMDYIKIEQARSYTELLNDLKYAMNKKKRDAEKQQAMMQMMQQAQMEQQLAQQQSLAGMKEEGANYRAELGAQTGMAKESLKAGLASEGSPEEGMMAEQEMQDQAMQEQAMQQMMGQQ